MTGLTPKVILEGTRLTFKTEIAFELNEHPHSRLAGNGTPGTSEGLQSPSQNDNLGVFIEQQELMRQLVRDSILPILKLDISDNRIPAALEPVADWLASTGGLYMPDCIMSLRGMIAVALGPQSDEAISSFIRRLLFEVSH